LIFLLAVGVSVLGYFSFISDYANRRFVYHSMETVFGGKVKN